MGETETYNASRVRLKKLVEKFCALDPQQEDFDEQYRLLTISANTTLEGLNHGAGNPKNMAIAREFALAARRERLQARRAAIRPHLKKLHDEGITTLRAIAKALNDRKVPPPNGAKTWTFNNVRPFLKDFE